MENTRSAFNNVISIDDEWIKSTATGSCGETGRRR